MYREESNGRQSVGQLAAAAKARFQQQQRHQRRQYTKKIALRCVALYLLIYCCYISNEIFLYTIPLIGTEPIKSENERWLMR